MILVRPRIMFNYFYRGTSARLLLPRLTSTGPLVRMPCKILSPGNQSFSTMSVSVLWKYMVNVTYPLNILDYWPTSIADKFVTIFLPASCVTDLCLAEQGDLGNTTSLTSDPILAATSVTDLVQVILSNYRTITGRHFMYLESLPRMCFSISGHPYSLLWLPDSLNHFSVQPFWLDFSLQFFLTCRTALATPTRRLYQLSTTPLFPMALTITTNSFPKHRILFSLFTFAK